MSDNIASTIHERTKSIGPVSMDKSLREQRNLLAKIARLEQENARLNGRIEELENEFPVVENKELVDVKVNVSAPKKRGRPRKESN